MTDEPHESPFPDRSGEPCAPPVPGRVDVALTGDVALAINGEGVVYSGELMASSNDVVGLGTEPKWTLSNYGELVFTLEGLHKKRSFVGPRLGEPGHTRVGDVFHLDAPLREHEGKGEAHIKGTVSIPRATAGTVPSDIAAILAKASGCKKKVVREHGTATATVVVPYAELREVARRVRAELPAGWVAFIGDHSPADAKNKKRRADVIVAPGTTQWDILRIGHVDATNYGITVEGIIKKLRAYDALLGLDIWQAHRGSVEAVIARLPADVGALAKEVYAFCPDIVDQGAGSVDALAKDIAEWKRLVLWWD